MREEILDLDEVMERVQNDKELLIELIEIFLEDCPGKIKGLREAARSNNRQQVADIAHSLKGSSGNLAAKRIATLFLQIEQKGKNDDMTNIPQILDEIEGHLKDLKSYLEHLREEFKDS